MSATAHQPLPTSPDTDGPDTTGMPDWPLRAWGLALLGGLTGLAVFAILRPDQRPMGLQPTDFHPTAATFLTVAGLVFAFVVERRHMAWSLIFALLSALVVAGATHGSTRAGFDEPWRILCAALAVGIAAPLFQAWRDQRLKNSQGGRWAIPYRPAHNHAWTNFVLWCAAWVFVVVVWLMAWLLAGLFNLIGIGILEDLLHKSWMQLALVGMALGGGIGLLRDRAPIVGLLQRVVTTVLSVLAPPLALGLAVFLIALPFTGLAPLWEATKSTTPILLCCVIGGLGLINAAIGDAPDHEARHPVLRSSVIVLCLALTPLAVIAAVSVGSRVSQHGLTPERLWAIIFTGIAVAYGLAYLVSLIRGRTKPAPFLRAANLKLAIGLCLVAFILSTPLINFNAISTRNQVARLNSGAVSADEFDWAALRFDFGQAGFTATEELARNGKTPAIRKAAAKALQQTDRWAARTVNPPIDAARLTILPRPVELPAALHEKLSQYNACGLHGPCAVIHEAGSDEAIIVVGQNVTLWHREGASWQPVEPAYGIAAPLRVRPEQLDKAVAAGKVEVRTIQRRQVFIDGQPVGADFK